MAKKEEETCKPIYPSARPDNAVGGAFFDLVNPDYQEEKVDKEKQQQIYGLVEGAYQRSLTDQTAMEVLADQLNNAGSAAINYAMNAMCDLAGYNAPAARSLREVLMKRRSPVAHGGPGKNDSPARTTPDPWKGPSWQERVGR